MSRPRNVFESFRSLLTHRWLWIYGILLVVLACYGWAMYLPYTRGLIPGHHQAAVFYGGFVSRIAFSLLLFGMIHVGLMVIPAIPILLIISSRPYWRSASRVVVYLFCFLGIYFTTLIAMWPAFTNSYLHHNALYVAPWGKTYRTSYIGSQLDDILGTIMVSECNLGGWCHPLYRHRGSISFDSAQDIRPRYDAVTDQLIVEIESERYVKSRYQ